MAAAEGKAAPSRPDDVDVVAGNEDPSGSSNNQKNNHNLIVNYLPNALSDEELYEIFERVGPLSSAKIMRNKLTGYSYGYGFVSFVDAADAASAIRQLDGAQLHHKRLKVAYCRRGSGENAAAEIKNANLFIANLPSNFTEDQLEEAFGKFGEIVRSKILLDHATGVSKGCGFVLFSKTAEADAALAALHGKLLDLPGFHFTHPLIVKKAKDENRPSHFSSGNGGNGNPSAQQHQQQHRSRPIHVIHHYATKDKEGLVVDPNGNAIPTSGARRYKGGATSDASVAAGVAPVATSNNDGSTSPVGHTLYVYGIGSLATELDLYALFAPFGAIVKVYVMRDPATRAGKGFGFVTYGDYHDACLAVQTLNGYPFHKNSMRPLQVSFKTPKSSTPGAASASTALHSGYAR